jgi:tetratricopeptide (TPR) repeat protein
MKWLLLICLISASPAMADCPELPDRSHERTELLQQLKIADTYNKGSAAIASMWLFWRVAPDEISQEMLGNGIKRIRMADYLAAEDALARLVKYCPEYAEGYNQLAFAHFLQGEYKQSLNGLDRTLEIEPLHFGALSGKALIYIKQGREDIAQVFLRRAIGINPWLNERFLLRSVKGSDDL